MWQPPQAPRMTAAAARASSMGGLYPDVTGFPARPFGHQQLMPWQAGPQAHMAHQQSHMHQHLEHQLILHQQLVKLQENRHDGFSVHASQPAFNQASRQDPYHNAYPAQSHRMSWQPDSDRSYGHNLLWAERRSAAPSEAHDYVGQAIRRAESNRSAQEWQEGAAGSLDWRQAQRSVPGFQRVGPWNSHGNGTYQNGLAGQMHVRHQHHSNQQHHPHAHHQPHFLNQPPQQHHFQHPVHASEESGRSTQWRGNPAPVQSGVSNAPLHWNDLSRAGVDQSMATSAAHSWAAAAAADAVANERLHSNASYVQRNFVAHGQSQAEGRPRASSTVVDDAAVIRDGKASIDTRSGLPAEHPAPPPSAQATQAESKGPAPPSPDTLDKSSVPIAAFGAQIIWNACAAFFDSDLLDEATEEAEAEQSGSSVESASGSQPSIPSSASTPSLATPSLSPWSSAVIGKAQESDWNAFRSPFGPERTTHLRAHAQSFDLSSEPVSDLHRIALGAGGASRSTSSPNNGLTDRHATSSSLGFSYADVRAGHSSGGSSVSSSEPGTPSSMASGSPTSSPSALIRSDGSTRAASRAVIGLGLDRSNSDSALPPRAPTRKHRSTSRWADRARDNIMSALRLISPAGPWSSNDDKLVSLEPATRTEPQPTQMPLQGRRQRDSITGIASTHASDASPAFRRFAHQVLSQTLLSPTAFLLGVMFALRLPYLARRADGSIEPEAIELFAQPTSAAPFKLFTLGMMISNKHLDDNTFTNKTWNEVTGIPLAELNQIEAYFLRKCNYEVTVPTSTWIRFLQSVKSREESRATALARSGERLSRTADANKSDSYKLFHEKAQSLFAGDQDCSKRLLLVVDDALIALDAIPRFELDNMCTNQTDAEMEQRESPSITFTEEAWGRMKQSRPVSELHSNHQHCRSAPVISATLGVEDDVFDDEHSPFRPTHLPRNGAEKENGARGPMLSRSQSDFGSVKTTRAPSAPSIEHLKSGGAGALSGPLAPSALLQGGRALLHGSAFAPLATSTWSQH